MDLKGTFILHNIYVFYTEITGMFSFVKIRAAVLYSQDAVIMY